MAWSRMAPYAPDIVATAPAEPGVYALHQKGLVILYGIAGSDLRESLTARLQTESNPCVLLSQEREIAVSWYLTPDPEAKLSELLAQFERVRGRLPRCQQSERSVGLVAEGRP